MKLATSRFVSILALILAVPLWAGRSFNGSSNVITANGTSTALDISSGPETIAFWWYPTSLSSVQAAVAHFTQGLTGSQFTVGTGFNVGGGADNQIGVQFGCCGAFGPAYTYCGTAAVVNHWYLVIAWADPAGADTANIFWFRPDNNTTCSADTAWGSPDRVAGQSSFTIGDESSGPTFPASGIIAHVAVWNIVLGPNFRTALETICPIGPASRRMGFPPPVGYFPLYGAASPEPDLSGHANNGTITGATTANGPPCTP
jgi:hypothetical protein